MRPEPFFVGDDPAMDFLNSTAAPWGAQIEWISSGQDLVQWMQGAGLLQAAAVAGLADTPEAKLNEVAAKARELREAFRLQMPHPSEEFLDDISGIMSRGSWRFQLKSGEEPEPVLVPIIERAEDLLPILARAITSFVCLSKPARRRHCGGPTCSLWFYDTSKNNRRRWCSMAVCGNRAKAAAHRARHS